VVSRIGADAARAMALFIFGLPGSAYVYNGQELGLPSGEMADSDRQDPIFFRTNGAQKGRDGARVPMPWSGENAPFGFTTGKPWLPLQDSWKEFTVESEDRDPSSSLNLYRNALRIRKEKLVGSGEIKWTNTDGLLSYKRGEIEVLINISDSAKAITGQVLLSSQPITDSLPPAAAVWLLP
jgi:alpha-glucosidase